MVDHARADSHSGSTASKQTAYPLVVRSAQSRRALDQKGDGPVPARATDQGRFLTALRVHMVWASVRYGNEAPPMTGDLPDTALELRSLVTSGCTLELSLHEVPVPTPGANEVLVRVEASPINPSDLGLLVASADMTTATVAGTPERPIVTASLGAGAL